MSSGPAGGTRIRTGGRGQDVGLGQACNAKGCEKCKSKTKTGRVSLSGAISQQQIKEHNLTNPTNIQMRSTGSVPGQDQRTKGQGLRKLTDQQAEMQLGQSLKLKRGQKGETSATHYNGSKNKI